MIALLLMTAAPMAAGRAQTSAPSRTFGPDTNRTGLFTGPGTPPGGLSCDAPPAPTAKTCSGFLASFDGTQLDVTVRVPQSATGGTGPHPLVVSLHGYGGSKNSSVGDVDKLADTGFTVLRYSARGFGDSWGQVNLADLNVEIRDLRSMISQVTNDPSLQADADAVGVFGASYGGIQSWLAAVEPTFTADPGGGQVRIRTIVPIVPATDLLYSLRPNGIPQNSIDVPGGFKSSFTEGLFFSGIRRSPARPYPNYPDYLFVWNQYLLGTEPNDDPPIGSQIVDAVAGYRSIWWQKRFWKQVIQNADPQNPDRQPPLPVFQIQGWTDDLFPVPEALRMYRTLRSIDASYPIALYLGDLGHPRARNKQGEVDFVSDQIRRWFEFYLKCKGVASATCVQPALDVQAALTRVRDQPFNPGDVVRVPTYDDLANGSVAHDFPGGEILTYNPANPSGAFFDPLVMAGAESLQPSPPPPPPDAIPGDVARYEVRVADLANGSALLIAGQPAVTVSISTTASREQLNVRLFDVEADGTEHLVTRGTFTVDTGNPLQPIGHRKLTITSYGNLWEAAQADVLRLEITNVDSPYIEPSRVPSLTRLGKVELAIPVRR
ncbi:MAG: alpha/beta fold hydrolase [Myxococcales bacterium]